MLETLDQVDWASLTHAYGPATDVPEMIRGLASEDEETREGALWGLYGNIWHQGTVYGATAHAVPFLIELLQAPPVAGKPEILGLLQAVANGSSFLDVHQRLEYYRSQSSTPEFIVQREQELVDAKSAHDAVVAGTPVYLSLLEHPDPAVRVMVPYLLGSCAERAEAIIPALRERFAGEADTTVKISLCLGLGRLWQAVGRKRVGSGTGLEAPAPFLSAISQSGSETSGTRLAAALALVQLSEGAPAAEALSVLRANLADGLAELERLPWREGDSLWDVEDSLDGHTSLYLELLLGLLEHPEPIRRCMAMRHIRGACQKRRDASFKVASRLAVMLVDSDADVRRGAAMTLSEIGSAASLVQAELLAFLANRTDDSSAEARFYAALALAKMRDVGALPTLLALASEPKLNQKVLNALKLLGPTALPAMPQLRRMLREPNDGQEQVRLAHVLGAIGPAAYEALPDLLRALQNPAAATGVAWALGQWGPGARNAVPGLQRVLTAENLYARRAAVKALGQIGPAAKAAVPSLAQLLHDPDPMLRVNAARALWQIASSAAAALPVLMAVLEEQREKPGREFICAAAAEALGEMGPAAQAAAPLLRKALTTDQQWARVQAACALWKIGCSADEILPTLLDEMKCRPTGFLVLECLGTMGSAARPAIPELRRIIASEERLPESAVHETWVDQDEAFQAAAIRALEHIEAAPTAAAQ